MTISKFELLYDTFFIKTVFLNFTGPNLQSETLRADFPLPLGDKNNTLALNACIEN